MTKPQEMPQRPLKARAQRVRYSWVKWDFRGEHKWICESCGDVCHFTRILPQPLILVAEMGRVFERYHQRCQDPRPARRGLLGVLAARARKASPNDRGNP